MDKLKAFLKKENITEEEAIDRLQVQMFDPAKDFYGTLVSASRQLMDAVKSKEIDLDDPYYKADRKSTRLNSSHSQQSRMPSSA